MPVYGDLLYLNGYKEVSDQTPFIFRRGGGGIGVNLGKRSKQTFFGGSIAWNQIVEETTAGWVLKNTVLSVNNGVWTISPTTNSSVYKYATKKMLTPGHVYYVRADGYTDTDVNYAFWIRAYSGGDVNVSSSQLVLLLPITSSHSYSRRETIFVPDDGYEYLYYLAGTGADTDTVGYIRNLGVFDLTIMFGPSIANYINELEENEAGSGISWIKKYGFFRREYYSYDAGSIQSVCIDNYYNTQSNLFFPIENIAKLVGGYSYKIEGTYQSLSYESFDGIEEVITPDQDGVFAPDNDGILTVTGASDYLYLHFVLDGSHDGKWAPPSKRPQSLQTTDLLGILELEGGDLVYNGDTYTHDGVITRRAVKTKFNGTESWTTMGSGANHYFRTKIGPYGSVYGAKIICNQYVRRDISVSNDLVGVSVFSSNSGGSGAYVAIRPKNVSSMTATQFKQLLANDPVTVVYLLTPNYETTESATSFRYPMPIDGWGIEEVIDHHYVNGDRDVEVPIGHSTMYYDMDLTRGDV